jgi:hypothetical protein
MPSHKNKGSDPPTILRNSRVHWALSRASKNNSYAELGIMDISRSKTVNAAPGKQLGAVFLMNELALVTEAKQWPEEIFVEPWRLATGIWGEREGDIAAAYCADTFPKIKTFSP